MVVTRLKLWRQVGVAALLGVSACGPAAEPAKQAAAGAVGEAGESAIGESGGEAGEAGAAAAFAGLAAGPQLTAMRLQQLKGFVLIAERAAQAGDVAGASVLIAQGKLEAYDPVKADFGSFDVTTLEAAEAAAAQGHPTAEIAGKFDAALAALTAARPAGADLADVTARMTDLASGIYQHVVQQDLVDPIEYQHSQGAALAARDALAAGRESLRARNAAAYDEAARELDRFVALWPSVTAPETPAPYGQLLAQSSRVRLALAPLLGGEE